MHPRQFALSDPDRPAYVMVPSGDVVTYGELEARANQAAWLFRERGLRQGDTVALFLENGPRFLEIVWAAHRAGLYFTCVSTKLSAGELEYITRDSGARLLICSAALVATAAAALKQLDNVALLIAGSADANGFEAAAQAMPTGPISDEAAGADMLYSSGTTGTPKGIRPAAIGGALDVPGPLYTIMKTRFRVPDNTRYLSPAPLYHTAPLRWAMQMHRLGNTVFIMEKFDATLALATIARHAIECAQFVPTHFIRMLKLPADVREAYDVTSLKCVVHAAAPCPIPVKEAMLAWWGPVIHEYYAGTEGNGFCCISAAEWLQHRGSVGRAVLGELRICDDDGAVLPPRAEGLVYFANGPVFSYHNDQAKTALAHHQQGWSTLGDIGRLDEEGYLYLTDRKSFMIISGGVNIYPQEIENLLVLHSKVMDVAVVGAPDDDLGEKVVAVVEPRDWQDATPALAAELLQFVRANLSHVKAPRLIEFVPELPRHPNGKLYKKLIRERYWKQRDGS